MRIYAGGGGRRSVTKLRFFLPCVFGRTWTLCDVEAAVQMGVFFARFDDELEYKSLEDNGECGSMWLVWSKSLSL